jgi:hypothetical protein
MRAPLRAIREDEPGIPRNTERAAGERFRDIDMPEIADDEPLPVRGSHGLPADRAPHGR